MIRAKHMWPLLVIGSTAALALPDGYLDPSNVSIKNGAIRVEGRDIASVQFTITNLTDKPLETVAVQCTALIDDEPIETNSDLPSGVGPKQKAFGTVNFLQLKGRPGATASCRVTWVKAS